MTPKQTWLLERLLVPAGILPPAVNYSDLKYNAQFRERIKNLGFEYMLLVQQDVTKIISSPIGKQIFAIHAPYPEIGHQALSNPFLMKVAKIIIASHAKPFPKDFLQMAKMTFDFAKPLGAKVITFHIHFFDHQKIVYELEELAKLEKEFGIMAAIEHEGHYFSSNMSPEPFLKVDDSYEWMWNPIKLVKQLDALSPKHQFQICLDTDSLIGYNLPIVETTKKIISRISHVHLAGGGKGQELAGEINRDDIAEVANILYENKYPGYITAEINATIGSEEEQLARFHGIFSTFGLDIFKGWMIRNAQRHIENSCQFLLRHLT